LVDLDDAIIGVARANLAMEYEVKSGGNTGAIGIQWENTSSARIARCRGRSHLPGPARGKTRKARAMYDRHASTGKKLKWLGMVGLLAALLLVSAVPGEARVRVFIGPGIVVPFGPFWAPYWTPYPYPYGYPYAYPPVVVGPPPQIYVQPAPPVAAQPPPPSYWYYCENPQGYYPYVQQCPGEWRQVPPRPP
jgi:hypothetical protein